MTVDEIHRSSSPSVGELGVNYRFSAFRLDPRNRLLVLGDAEVAITGRAFDTLHYLVQHPGELVTKNELMEAVWANRIVEESNLTVAISTLRKALSIDQEGRKFIQTVSGQGYRFVGTVELVAQPPAIKNIPVPLLPEEEDADSALVLETPDNEVPLPSARPGSSKLRRRIAFGALAAMVLASVGFFLWKGQRSSADPHLQSIAILPFSGSGIDDYVLQGMTEAMITQAAGRVAVRPISSVVRYAHLPLDVKRAGREQSVDAVVVGNLSRTSSSTSLDLKLVLASDGRTLWSRSFSAEPEHLQQLQETACYSLNAELQRFTTHRVSPSKRQGQQHVPSDQAYSLYMRGRYLWNLRTEEGLNQSIEYFRQSITADPDYALAFAGMADSYVLQGAAIASADARAAALSAIHLDPDLAEPHASLGMIYFFGEWNRPKAELEFQRSIALDPNYATAHQWYGQELAATGNLPKAIYEMQLAQNLDPLSLIIGTDLGWAAYLNRDYDGAISEYRRVLELDPAFVRALVRIGYADLRKGDTAEAVKNLKAAQKLTNAPYVLALLGYAQAMNGETAAAESILQSIRPTSDSKNYPAFELSLVCLALHRKEDAMQFLEKATQQHSSGLIYAKVDPALDPLRGDPRFQKILAKMNL